MDDEVDTYILNIDLRIRATSYADAYDILESIASVSECAISLGPVAEKSLFEELGVLYE